MTRTFADFYSFRGILDVESQGGKAGDPVFIFETSAGSGNSFCVTRDRLLEVYKEATAQPANSLPKGFNLVMEAALIAAWRHAGFEELETRTATVNHIAENGFVAPRPVPA